MPDYFRPRSCPASDPLIEMADLDLGDACKIPWDKWQDALRDALTLVWGREEDERNAISCIRAEVRRRALHDAARTVCIYCDGQVVGHEATASPPDEDRAMWHHKRTEDDPARMGDGTVWPLLPVCNASGIHALVQETNEG